MRARILEVLLGAAVVALPWWLGGPGGAAGVAVPVLGVAVVALSTGSFARRFRRAHLGNLLTGGALAGAGWLQAPRPGPAWAQALIVAGLLLVLLAVVPTASHRPPAGWRRHMAEVE